MLRMILAFLLLFLGVALGQPQTLAARLGLGKDFSAVFAAADARLNAALMQGRLALGLQEPEPEFADEAGVSNVAEVQGALAPKSGSAKRVKANALVAVTPRMAGDIASSPSVKMVDGLAHKRLNKGARFVKVDSSP